MTQVTRTQTSTGQAGAVLFTSLVLLVLLTMLGLSTMFTSTMEERMAANSQEINRAFQAASTGLALAFDDPAAFDTTLTPENDGSATDLYAKSDNTIGWTGLGGYTATTDYNSVFRQSTAPKRGSGWDSSYAYFHFHLSASGGTESGAISTLHGGAYQVGRAP